MKTSRGRTSYAPPVNAKLGDLVPPVIAGSLVTAAATLTLLPVVLGVVEMIREAIPKSASNPPSAVGRPRRNAATVPAGRIRSNRTPRPGERKETTT